IVNRVPLQPAPAEELSALPGPEDPEPEAVLCPVGIVLHKPVLGHLVRSNLAIRRERVHHLRMQVQPTDLRVVSRGELLGCHAARGEAGSSVFKCNTSRIGPSGPWPSGGCARSSSRSLATPDSSPGSIGPTDSSLTSVHRYAW